MHYDNLIYTTDGIKNNLFIDNYVDTVNHNTVGSITVDDLIQSREKVLVERIERIYVS